MMPHCKSDNQFELFESAATDGQRPPKLALPFQRSAEVDIRRAKAILGVSSQKVPRLIRAGLIRGYKGIGGFRIEYQSVVDFCDLLRMQYHISDSTAPRATLSRRRDREILPFPLDETVSVKHVMDRLDCSIQAVLNMIEEGALVAYKLGDGGAGTPWRIHDKSVDRYIASLRASVPAKATLAGNPSLPRIATPRL